MRISCDSGGFWLSDNRLCVNLLDSEAVDFLFLKSAQKQGYLRRVVLPRLKQEKGEQAEILINWLRSGLFSREIEKSKCEAIQFKGSFICDDDLILDARIQVVIELNSNSMYGSYLLDKQNVSKYVVPGKDNIPNDENEREIQLFKNRLIGKAIEEIKLDYNCTMVRYESR